MGNNFKRILQLPDLTKKSVFLWGPRKVGKSTWIKETLRENIYIDLLKSDTFSEYASRPSLLRERYNHIDNLIKKPIIIDEIQKCPSLLDEVHWMIENSRQTFLLTGSSARKLRKQHANLLGGRAWRREMRPLCYPEIPDYDLDKVITHGLIPSHYNSDSVEEDLRSYISDYLKEEIAQEALVRNLPAFSDFLRVASISSSELLNYTNVGREVGVSAKVVRSYFEILEDTLLGFRVVPWRTSKNRRMVETEKFYFFDVGVSNFLSKRKPARGTPEYGKSFEHTVLTELYAYKAYREPELDLTFWRTSNKQEVDFIINDKQVAIETKSSTRIHDTDCKNLTLLSEDGPVRSRIIVSNENQSKVLHDRFGKIFVFSFYDFMEKLWGGDILS